MQALELEMIPGERAEVQWVRMGSGRHRPIELSNLMCPLRRLSIGPWS